MRLQQYSRACKSLRHTRYESKKCSSASLPCQIECVLREREREPTRLFRIRRASTYSRTKIIHDNIPEWLGTVHINNLAVIWRSFALYHCHRLSSIRQSKRLSMSRRARWQNRYCYRIDSGLMNECKNSHVQHTWPTVRGKFSAREIKEGVFLERARTYGNETVVLESVWYNEEEIPRRPWIIHRDYKRARSLFSSRATTDARLSAPLSAVTIAPHLARLATTTDNIRAR